jgi:hypothetical protein
MYLDSDIRLSLAAEAAALEAHAVMLGEAIEMLDGDIRAASERLARLRGPARTTRPRWTRATGFPDIGARWEAGGRDDDECCRITACVTTWLRASARSHLSSSVLGTRC